jgi:hypothetical protein
MTARVSCLLCCSSESGLPPTTIVDMMFPPVTALRQAAPATREQNALSSDIPQMTKDQRER